MLWPKKAKGQFRNGRRACAIALTKSEIRVNGGSASRFSRPGSWIGHTVTSGGSMPFHVWNMEVPPPAYGKQKRRKVLCELRLLIHDVIDATAIAIDFLLFQNNSQLCAFYIFLTQRMNT